MEEDYTCGTFFAGSIDSGRHNDLNFDEKTRNFLNVSGAPGNLSDGIGIKPHRHKGISIGCVKLLYFTV